MQVLLLKTIDRFFYVDVYSDEHKVTQNMTHADFILLRTVVIYETNKF